MLARKAPARPTVPSSSWPVRWMRPLSLGSVGAVTKSPVGAGQAEGGGEAAEGDDRLHDLSGQDHEGTQDYVAHFLPPMNQDPGPSIIQDL